MIFCSRHLGIDTVLGVSGLSQCYKLVVGLLTPALVNTDGLKSSPSVCFLEHFLCKKEGLGMLGRLVSRKGAQLRVKRKGTWGMCPAWQTGLWPI